MEDSRDPQQIERIVELLRQVWELHPGFRLTQLVMAVSDKTDDAAALWHIPDAAMEQRLRHWRDNPPAAIYP